MIGEASENEINNARPFLEDHDDIVVAVEVFRSEGYVPSNNIDRRKAELQEKLALNENLINNL